MAKRRKYGKRSRRKRSKRVLLFVRRKVKKSRLRNNRAMRRPEVKRVIAESSYTGFNPLISVSGDLLNVLPSISQGVSSTTRVGNRILVKSITIRGVITLTYPNTAIRFAKIGVRHMLLRRKDKRNYANITTNDLQVLLQGSGGFTGYNGTIINHLSAINQTAWVAGKDKRFIMNGPTVIGVTGEIEAPNATVTRTFTWKLGKGATLLYEENNPIPVNWPWVMALGFTYWDNSIASSLDVPINLQYQTTMDYYDN